MTTISVTEIINALEDARHELTATQVQFHKMGLDWDRTQDSRSAWFDGTWKVLALTQAHLHLFRSHLQHLKFWQDISRNITGEILEALKSEANTLYQFSVVHTTYSQLEESLRRVTEAFDPAWIRERRSIAAVQQHLMEELGLQRYKELFRLSRLIRNTIHNNGYFRPDPPVNDATVIWAGKTYEFRVDQVVLFMGDWRFIADHIKDLCEVMTQIVTLPTIKRSA